MRLGLGSLSSLACVLLLAATASADPFTGRYNIVSLPDSHGVSISGYIDFASAPMGTTAFNLGASFVSAFRIVASGPGFFTIVYDDLAYAYTDQAIDFDGALGASTLTPLDLGPNEYWFGRGIVGFNNYGDALIWLRATTGGGVDWFTYDGNPGLGALSVATAAGADVPAWRLVLEQPVPEPGALALIGLAVTAGVAWRRRTRGR